MKLRNPTIRRVSPVYDLAMLERKPAVVVYREDAFAAPADDVSEQKNVMYIYLAGKDAKEESEKILAGRPGKFKEFVDDLPASFEAHYLHLIGSPDFLHWTREEARVNLGGYLRLQKTEANLIEEYREWSKGLFNREGNLPPRNGRKGGGGRNPRWVNHWLSELGYSHLRDFRREVEGSA